MGAGVFGVVSIIIVAAAAAGGGGGGGVVVVVAAAAEVVVAVVLVVVLVMVVAVEEEEEKKRGQANEIAMLARPSWLSTIMLHTYPSLGNFSLRGSWFQKDSRGISRLPSMGEQLAFGRRYWYNTNTQVRKPEFINWRHAGVAPSPQHNMKLPKDDRLFEPACC